MIQLHVWNGCECLPVEPFEYYGSWISLSIWGFHCQHQMVVLCTLSKPSYQSIQEGCQSWLILPESLLCSHTYFNLMNARDESDVASQSRWELEFFVIIPAKRMWLKQSLAVHRKHEDILCWIWVVPHIHNASDKKSLITFIWSPLTYDACA